MTNFQKRIASAVAVASMLLNAMPVLAQTTTIQITGNGAETNNDANVTVTSSTTVVQNNTANISNNVDASSSTGGNTASKNTGGNVDIDTGNASTNVSVNNTANSNKADVNGCCAVNTTVDISENGWKSDNTANLNLATFTNVTQNNTANIKNYIDADSDTGENKANKNTGGSVNISTGNATTNVSVSNSANANWAQIGNGSPSGSVSLKILKNGAESDNDINLKLTRSLTLVQDNLANIKNKVDADSDTGENKANKNTGGSVSIDTGNAKTNVEVDNLANFNWADLDCGCLLSVLAKIAENGWNSDNTILADLTDFKVAVQNNDFVCGKGPYPEGKHKKACNNVDAGSETGGNKVKENTGSSGVDPSIETGNAETDVNIETTANSNVLSEGTSPLPPLPDFDLDFDLGFNWVVFWAWLSGMMG